MSQTTGLPAATKNYLVPAGGTTHCVKFGAAIVEGNQTIFDYGSFSLQNNLAFIPQGAYIDNSASLNDVTLTVSPIGYSITISAGAQESVQFPAIIGGKIVFTGLGGIMTAFFVDYPLLPSGSVVTIGSPVTLAAGSEVTIAAPVQIAGGVTLSTSAPLDTIPSATPAGGGGYSVSQTDSGNMLVFAGTIAAGQTSISFNTSQYRIRRFRLSIPASAYITGGADITLFANYDGNTIYNDIVSIPSAAPASPAGQLYTIDLDFGRFTVTGLNNPNVFKVTTSQALTGGSILAQAYTI